MKALNLLVFQRKPSQNGESDLDGEVLELLPRREVDHVLVDAVAPLEELLVEQVEDHLRPRLRVHRDAEVVGVAGGDANVTWKRRKRQCQRSRMMGDNASAIL